MEQNEEAIQDDSLLRAKAKLLLRIKQGSPSPAKVSSLKLSEIQSLPTVFQHRNNNMALSESHVRELAKCLVRNPKEPFDKLVVYWIGDCWCLIDGHHRLQAYQETNFKLEIPVSVFIGTLDEALLFSLSKNSKDKLPMSNIEKSNAAWRLVISIKSSKACIAKAASVSERTVAYMRNVMRELSTRHQNIALDELNWFEARKLWERNQLDSFTGSPDWLEQEAETLAGRFVKHFGKRLGDNPEVTLRAIEIYDSRLYSYMCEQAKDYDGENDDF